MIRRFVAASLVVAALAMACQGALPSGSPVGSPSPVPTALLSPSPTASATPSASPLASASPSHSPTASANTAAPAELAGRWVATISTGETVYLTLRGNIYGVERGTASGGGRIDVTGDQVHFSNGSPCPDPGTYMWVVEGGSLTFGSKGDACSGWRDVLLGQAWQRAG